MKKVMLLLVFLFSPMAMARSGAVFIYFYTPGQVSPGKPSYLFQKFKEQFGNEISEFYLIKAGTRDELSAGLRNLQVAHDVKIAKVVISSHGDSDIKSVPVYNSEGELISETEYNYIRFGGGGKGRVRFQIPHNPDGIGPEEGGQALFEDFGKLRTHIADQCDIHCTSCWILKGSEDARDKKIDFLANLFGVKNGRIYANAVEGHMSGVMYTAPWNQSTFFMAYIGAMYPLALGVSVTAGIFVTPLGFAVPAGALALEYWAMFKRNKGYEAEIKNGRRMAVGRQRSEVFAAKFFNRNSCAYLLRPFQSYVGF